MITSLETWKVERGLENASKSYYRVTFMAMPSQDKFKGRRVAACQRLIINERQHPPIMNTIPSPTYNECEYFLRSRNPRPVLGRTNRLNDFVTVNINILCNCVCFLTAYPAIQSMLQLGKINKHLSISL